MAYPVTKSGGLFGGAIQALSSQPSLAMQHLEYNLTMERNRAIMTQHAMNNTAVLMSLATEIMEDNPASAGALKEIMEAYVDATSESIYGYGKPIKYHK